MLKTLLIQLLKRKGLLSKPLAEYIYEGLYERASLGEFATNFPETEKENIAEDIQDFLERQI